MGTERKFNKTPRTRPKKSFADRKRRQKTQAKRLVGLGADATAVGKMNPKEVRTALQRPAKVVAAAVKLAAAASK